MFGRIQVRLSAGYEPYITYYAIFRTDKGAQQAFFSTDPSIYVKSVDVFKKKVIASLTLIR
jgi:hypothetical protein